MPNPGHVFARSAEGAVGDAFARQGKEDWEAFLTLRLLELRPGARLIVVMPSLDENGLHPSAVLFDCANDVLAEMVAEGAITGAERERMLISQLSAHIGRVARSIRAAEAILRTKPNPLLGCCGRRRGVADAIRAR